MKKRFLSFTVCGFLLFSLSCSDDETITHSGTLSLYGEKYSLQQGGIWQDDNNLVIRAEDYVFVDRYRLNDQDYSDTVRGFTAQVEQRQTGNFILCLYEESFRISETLQSAKGNGACIGFHLSSPETDRLSPGKYTYSLNKEGYTFKGYSGAAYDATKNTELNELTEGEVDITENAGIYQVVFQCKTGFGGTVTGQYTGRLKLFDVRRNADVVTTYPDIKLEALYDTVTFMDEGIEKKEPDYLRGTAFLMSSGQTALSARDCAGLGATSRKNVDIALVYDQTDRTVYFESPIRMRSLLWHNTFENYNFDLPCHTKYMKAPAMTDSDFEHITDKKDFAIEIKEEKVKIPVGTSVPVFLYVETGLGEIGVIRVKRVTPEGREIAAGKEYPVNPNVIMDIKFPKTYSESKIR